VDIGAEVLTVVIHEGGRPYAVALQKDAGGREADAIIEGAILDDDAELIQASKTMASADERVHGAILEYSFKVYTAIQEAILSYTDSHPELEPKVQGITLTGGGSLLRTLAATLKNSFRVPVEIGTLDTAVTGEAVRYNTDQKMSACYAAAVGLAMGATV